MKSLICTIAGAVGGVVAALFGGWTEGMLLLVILMAIDYISGLVVAGVFHRSPKSGGGGLESKAGLKGLIRKIFVLMLVAVAHIIDRYIGTDYVRDAVVIGFGLNEVISILENAGLMGIKLPKVIYKALDVLRNKAGEQEDPAEPDGETTSSVSLEADTFPSRGRLSEDPAGEDGVVTRGMPGLGAAGAEHDPVYDPETLAILLNTEPDGAGEDEDGGASDGT